MAGQCTYRDVDAPALPVILVGVVVQAHTGSPGLEHSIYRCTDPPRSRSVSYFGWASYALLRRDEYLSGGVFLLRLPRTLSRAEAHLLCTLARRSRSYFSYPPIRQL